MKKKKTLGTGDVAEKSGLNSRRIQQICLTMSQKDMDRLGIYDNSSGYQIPPAALKDDLFKRKRKKKS